MLEMARRNILQKDAVTVPAAATIYCMGIEALTGDVAGFDMNAINKYRWDSQYQSIRLETIKHTKLTKAVKVFELFFDGTRKNKSREAVLKLPVIEDGIMNAIVFWFDLHLDDTESITSAPVGIGLAGEMMMFVNGNNYDDDHNQSVLRNITSLNSINNDSIASNENSTTATTKPQATATSTVDAAARAIAEALKNSDDSDEDAVSAAIKLAQDLQNKCNTLHNGEDLLTHSLLTTATDLQLASVATDTKNKDKTKYSSVLDRVLEEEHYWGQAVQYLDRAIKVEKKRKVTVLAKRERNNIRFSLREGSGVAVGKPPWKVEWGGGASVESPHVQRVHYCELLVKDFLMRLRCKRFPPIEKDLKMVLAQCGSLYLEPGVLQKIYHEFCVMELIHGNQEYCPGASMEAMTRALMELH